MKNIGYALLVMGSLFQTQFIVGEDLRNPTDTSLNQEENVLVDTQIKPDGMMLRDAEGSTIQMLPNGTKVIQKTDGTLIQIKPDGSKLIQSADGSSIQIQSDGTKIIKKADGTTIEVKPGSNSSAKIN